FNVRIADFYGAEGYTLHYDITPSSIRVWMTDDFGSEPKTLATINLSATQRRELATRLQRLPLQAMRDIYENPRVSDGLQLTFDIQVGSAPRKVIQIRNVYQR